MLAVRFDIIIPSLGPSHPTQQLFYEKNTEKIVSLVFSVTCNIFYGFTLKKPQKNDQVNSPSSEENKKTTPSDDFFGNQKKNINNDNEVQYLVQYFIQPYFIITNLPKKEEKSESPEIQQQQYSEIDGDSKKFSFLVAGDTEGIQLPPEPTLPSLMGQLSHLLRTNHPKPETPQLQSVAKIQPETPFPIENPPIISDDKPEFVHHVQKNLSENISDNEPEFVLHVRKILSENISDDVKLCEDGVGGTYFIRDHNRNPFAVFKPTDEEPGAVLNPKKKFDKPLLPPGGGALREYAAFLLDDGHAGVPETFLVNNISHGNMSNGGSLPILKSGSLQRFVVNKGDSSSISPSRFSVEDVHAVAILDLRILNLDRNGENLLVCKPSTVTEDRKKSEQQEVVRLVPIDHTYILPPSLDYDPYFEWHYWRQTKVPMSPETLLYIESLNPDRDAERLRSAGIDEDSIRTMKITTLLLKKGASVGLTLFDIANMVCRGRNKKRSELSEIVACAENAQAEFWSQLTLLIEQAVSSKKEVK